MVSQFDQPDHDAQNPGDYKGAIDPSIAVNARLGAWFAAHESATPAMTVDVDPGWVLNGLTLTEKALQTTATITAPSVDPRIDRVVIDDTTGAVSVIAGAEAPSPVPPALTAGKLPLAQVALVVSQTEIVNADITDERAYPLQVAVGFEAGTRVFFQQSTAPTGWTKETVHNDKALRVVTGTAGSAGATAFTSVFGASKVTGGHTLITSEMPAHTHETVRETPDDNLFDDADGLARVGTDTGTSGSQGGSGSHDHTLSLDLQYVDVIIAIKD